MVDDPSACPEEFPTEEDQKQERERLFRLIEELVRWENTTNEELLEQARAEIRRSWRRTCADNAGHPRAAELFDPDKLPAFHDPFAGGGALPLEAQRLGLEAHASDLNPVAVLINKAMIEIPPKFAGRPPVNPEARPGGIVGQGVADRARLDRGAGARRGRALLREVDARRGGAAHRASVSAGRGHRGDGAGAARPQAVPGPKADGDRLAVGAHGEEPEPGLRRRRGAAGLDLHAVDEAGQGGVCRAGDRGRGYRFAVKVGKPPDADAAKAGTKLARGSFRCLLSGVPIRYEYIDDEANAGRMKERLMAIVAAGDRGTNIPSPNT